VIGITRRREQDPADVVRSARIEAARRNQFWTELEEIDLVRRPPGYLVSASNDEVFWPYRGAVFAAWSAELISGSAPLWFYVDRDGDLVFLERLPETWSEMVERRVRRGRVPA
jgi:hypothetical protein